MAQWAIELGFQDEVELVGEARKLLYSLRALGSVSCYIACEPWVA